MNRKIIKIAALLVLVIGIIYFALHPEITGFAPHKQGAVAKVDNKVQEKLKSEGTVNAIIFLKEAEGNDLSIQKSENKEFKIEKIKQKAKLEQDSFEKKSTARIKHKYGSMGAVIAEINQAELDELKNDPDVEKIVMPQNARIHLQTSVPYINADKIWNITANGINVNGTGQTVCVIDTGVDYTHPDFGGCTNDTFLAGNCPKVIGGYDFANNDPDPMDDNGHGTMVAGIIAANGQIKGVAPEARIVAVKACDAGGNCNGTIENSIDWCISNAANYNITVISISLGSTNIYSGYCDSGIGSSEKPFVDEAVANGLMVVSSSGNDRIKNSIDAPACLANATSVGSVYHFNASSVTYDWINCTDNNVTPDEVPCYSNTGDVLDFIAPGVRINTTYLGSSYNNIFSGTSFSAPHMSGLILLLDQYLNITGNRQLSPSKIEELLKANSGVGFDDENGRNFTIPDALSVITRNIFIINESEKSIQNSYGKAILNTTNGLENASLIFTIGDKFISLNSSQYPQFNVSANITLYNLGYVKTPIILRNGVPCLDCQVLLSYDGNLTFYVPHFTNYSVTANSRLMIFDENDPEGGFLNRSNIENTLFFANYTNATDNSDISTANCNITYSDNASAVFTMTFNSSNGLYYYAKNFSNPGNYDYNISCLETNYEPINLSDSITSLPGCGLPPPNIDWVIPENSTVECNNTILYFQNQTLVTRSNSTFVLMNTTFFLKESVITRNIIINESANFTMYNATIISNVSNRFNIFLRGYGDVHNSVFYKSQPHFQGNASHILRDSYFNDSVYFEERTTNYIYYSTINASLYFYNNTKNYVTNCNIQTANSLDYSINYIQNSTFSGTPAAFYLKLNSTTNFTLPQSVIIGRIMGYQNATIYGYINMPVNGSVIQETLIRYYPVWINFTNGSPAVGKQVNVTNGTTVVWSGLTDSQGIAYPNLTFGVGTYNNNTPYLNISVNPTKDIGLLTDTPIIFELDNIPPGLIVQLPQNNSHYNTTNIILNYTVWDDINVSVCWYTNVTGQNETLPECINNTYSNITFTAIEGLNNITVYVNDTSNNINLTQIFFTVDTVMPSVSLNYPPDGFLTNNNTINFNWTARNGIGTNLTCNLTINNVIVASNVPSLNNTPTNYTIPGFANGLHFWNVTCWDDSGNANTSETRNFTIDTTVPAVGLNSPRNGFFTENNSINFNWTATNGMDTNLSCNLSINSTVNASNVASLNNTPTNYSVEGFLEGFYLWNVTCIDDAGNANSSETWNFTIDTTAPVVRLESPPNSSVITNTRNVTFRYNVTDNTNISNCSLRINNAVNKTNYSITINTTQNFTANDMPNGRYNWSVLCYDIAGNSNTSETWTLTIRLGTSPPGGGDGGGGGGGGGIIIPPSDEGGVEPPGPPPNDIIPVTPKEMPPEKEKPVKVSSNAGIVAKKGNLEGVLFFAAGVIIAIWLLYFPLFYFYRRDFAEDYVIERFIREDRLKRYRKLFVAREVYQRYKRKFMEEKKQCNLAPIHLRKSDEKTIGHLAYKYQISTELAKLITAARRGIISRILTKEKISDELRKEFIKIRFENPFEYEH